MTEANPSQSQIHGSNPAESQSQLPQRISAGVLPPVEAVPSLSKTIDEDNSELPRPTGTSGSAVEAETAIQPMREPSDADIPDETTKWVDAQIPKKKTGKAILSLAKNRERKDIADIERYVALLAEKGTIPMSGKRASTNDAKISKPVSSSASQIPLPGPEMEAVEVLISEIRRNAQIRAKGLNEENVQRIMEDFDSSKPVVFFERPEGELELVDGHHRLEAAKRLGRTSIQAYIRKGTLFDGLIFAYKINDGHGKHLGKEDRKHALAMIKATPDGSKLTGDQLADKLRVSRQTIHTYLTELNTVAAVKKKQPDLAASRKKAVASLVRFENKFGLDLFRDFIDSLDDDQRAELRAMLDDKTQ